MATARVVLDKRKAKQDGTYPVKIRVAHVKDFERISTSISLSENDFQKMMSGKHLNETLKTYKVKLDALIVKANGIIDSLDPFDFETFKTRFMQKGSRTDLVFLLNEKAANFAIEEKYSSENLYKQTAAFLVAFLNRSRPAKADPLNVLPLNQVTPKLLSDVEKWALKVTYDNKTKFGAVTQFKYSKTTISMYMIRIRSIFNDVISSKELSPNAYPFHRPDNKAGYKIPKPANNKRALSMAQIMEIYNFEASTETEQFAKDIFMFSYLASGMNMVDIFKLKWADIQNNQFTFIRKKTQNKTGGSNKITIPLNDDLRAIISRQGARKIGNDYIFNVIPAKATEKELISKVRIAIASINPALKKIVNKLGWEEDRISTYFARHSYSTNLMNNEAPLAFISKQLGHADLKTTQNYLDSFTSDKAEQYQSKLLIKDNKTA